MIGDFLSCRIFELLPRLFYFFPCFFLFFCEVFKLNVVPASAIEHFNQFNFFNDALNSTNAWASGATSNDNVYAEKGTASAVAPTQANLNATEPQSVISRAFIEEMTPPTGNLNTIISIAPSMASSVSPNGPGLMDTKTSMRGFQDGQYNMTFDGIPWGTAEVMHRTRARLRTLGWRWRELRTLWDVDRPEDLRRLRRSGLLGRA